MDGKGSRGLSSGNDRQRQHKLLKLGKKCAKYLVTHKQSLLAVILLTGLVALLFGVSSQLQVPSTNAPPSGTTAVDYSTLVTQVKAGNVVAVTIRGNEVNGLLAQPLQQVQAGTSARATITPNQRAADFAALSRFVGAGSVWANLPPASAIDPSRLIYTRIPAGGDAALTSVLLSNDVIVNTLPVQQTPAWLSLLWRFAPFVLLVLIFALILTPRNSGRSTRALDERISQIGKSRARRFERAKEGPAPSRAPEKSANATRPVNPPTAAARKPLEPVVTFADVAGIDEVRAELEEIVQFLRNPDRYDRLGARIPRGALLVGPPGTGKTLLAKAVAGEAGVPFFSMSASEFVEMFVGVGASRVRDLFNQARQSAPCVTFLDEIDRFNMRRAVVVMAATNRADILDKALLRPGRFDRHITVSLPDRVGRQAILAVHSRRTPLHEDVSLERLARLTTGMSGADLANLVNEAALGAARRDLEHVTHECFEEALVRVQLGALRPIVMSEAEKRIIAHHEGGHALVAYHLPQADTVNRVTILPRGQSLGVTQFIAEEDRYNYSRETLMARITFGLGGRAAEELTFGPERVTNGAENDLQVVTDLARRMVTRWGMSEQVGVVFADYQAESAGAGLNMRRIEQDEVPTNAHSLIADSSGRLRINGADLPVRQHSFAMLAPGANRASSATMATIIDNEVQRILTEG